MGVTLSMDPGERITLLREAAAIIRDLDDQPNSLGDVLTALGRRAEAVATWRRYLTLATDPQLIRETTALDDDSDARTTIDRIEKKLAALSE